MKRSAMLLLALGLSGSICYAASKPDLSGVWTRDAPFTVPSRAMNAELYRPDYKKRYQVSSAAVANGTLDLGANCQPTGPIRAGEIGQFEIFNAPNNRIIIIYEFMSQVRRLLLNGKQPDYIDPTVNGLSLAHWEGSTLVVDTQGISEFVYLDRSAGPHSDKLHVTERISLVNKDLLRVDSKVEDADALLQPWTFSTNYRRVPNGELIDYECTENPRNPINADGSVGFEFQKTR
ncbi:MAG: hypothetical protein QM808_04550 [Steroidobacteraceae bacterium]